MRVYFVFFFFQAEDGIRDKLVTGVQTCALPIYSASSAAAVAPFFAATRCGRFVLRPMRSDEVGSGASTGASSVSSMSAFRSEERRVGKECRSRWWAYH